MENVQVFPLGTKVKFGQDRDVQGKITAITLRPSLVMYEVSYWAGPEFKSGWLSTDEFEINKKKAIKLGFVTQNEEVS